MICRDSKLKCCILFWVATLFLHQSLFAQSAIPAEYRPVHFQTIDGEQIFFARLAMLLPYGDDSIIAVDVDEIELWLLNVSTGLGRMIGRQGSGPGEYYTPEPVGIVGDTLIVADALTRIIRFLLPSGEHLETRTYVQGMAIGSYVPAGSDGFYAVQHTYRDAGECLFQRYSTDGDLVARYEEWDTCEKY